MRYCVILGAFLAMPSVALAQGTDVQSMEDRIGKNIGQLILRGTACEVHRDTLLEQVDRLTKRVKELEPSGKEPK